MNYGEILTRALAISWRHKYMWLLNLVIAVAALAIIASFALVTIAAAMHSNIPLAVVTGLAAGLLVLVAIPAAIAFTVVIRLAVRAVVLDEKQPFAAVAVAFRLLRRRLGRVALLWLVAVVAGAVGGLIVIASVIIVALPLAALTAAAYFA